MKHNKLVDWLEVVANLGIVIGLILVLLQMNQNEDLLRAELLTQYIDSYAAYESAITGENLPAIWEKSLLEPENLSLGEMRALEVVTFTPLSRWINLYRLNKAGILNTIDWEREVRNESKYYFGTPYGRAHWEHFSQGMGDSLPLEIKTLVEEQLDNPAVFGPREHYEAVQKIVLRNKEQIESPL